MSGQTQERAFEVHVEEGVHRQGGWQSGTNAEWDVERALFPCAGCSVPGKHAAQALGRDAHLHAAGLEKLLIGTPGQGARHQGRAARASSRLQVLRQVFRLATSSRRTASTRKCWRSTPGTGSRSRDRPLPSAARHDAVDLLFAVNGLPVATCELKNPGTGQRGATRSSVPGGPRSARAALRFKKRALVHFAADPDEVHMTTRLAARKTHFLPFNRGSHPGEVQCGAGNPQHPSGYRTGYFWEEVLAARQLPRHPRPLHVHREEGREGRRRQGRARRITKETMIFPRYHQLDAVRKLVAHARSEGAGQQLPDPALGRQRQDQHASPGSRIGSPACTTPTDRRSSTASSSSPIGACSTSSFRTRSTRSSTRRAWSRRSTRTRSSSRRR